MIRMSFAFGFFLRLVFSDASGIARDFYFKATYRQLVTELFRQPIIFSLIQFAYVVCVCRIRIELDTLEFLYAERRYKKILQHERRAYQDCSVLCNV